MNVCRALGFVFLVVLTSCAQHSYRNNEVIVNSTSSALSFEGRGAGAGMMLMSSMGPAGIAIGVAIDVGIAKEIEKAVNTTSVTFEQLLQRQLGMGCAKFDSKLSSTQLETVSVEKYGFRVSKGDSESVVAWFSIALNNNAEATINFPADFDELDTALPSIPFNVVKSDGEAAVQLWRNSLAVTCGG
ncbi:hypothetical protein [Saccharophagus degradans]|uniref:Lipoprotein n=1 Tax=Saccharophagus degradans (strain 2-40 / ATCC 43961 / DSM 17024) TaxID=203122 RepID=Q21GB2_SACD2|nr:hypothetical protein [Saccharophagus degradans]ABD82267.1 hypothetical protein Sde_3010 [Saccharophagus degradans 2-40]